jgi:hypothetical protein
MGKRWRRWRVAGARIGTRLAPPPSAALAGLRGRIRSSLPLDAPSLGSVRVVRGLYRAGPRRIGLLAIRRRLRAAASVRFRRVELRIQLALLHRM